MKYYLGACVILSSILLGCTIESSQASNISVERYMVKLVFFDFYDDDVRLSINGVEVINKHLNVADFNDTTGLNFVQEQEVMNENVFHLKTNVLDIKKTIIVSPSTALIYINPSVEPYIETSTSDIITLD